MSRWRAGTILGFELRYRRIQGVTTAFYLANAAGRDFLRKSKRISVYHSNNTAKGKYV